MNSEDIVINYKCGNENNYHTKQIQEPYRSTVLFVDWLKEKEDIFVDNSRVLDMACGGGANLYYLSRRFKNVAYEGIDYDRELVDMARDTCQGCDNVKRIMQDDWFNLEKELIGKYDGIVSFQTLSWLSNYEKAIEALTELNPKWIAISSLFYEGDIDYFIDLSCYRNGYDIGENLYKYNVYSLPRVEYLFSRLGYKHFEYTPFKIDIDLDEKNVDKRWIGTYTKKLEDGDRIQISGGIMMPWYFILARK